MSRKPRVVKGDVVRLRFLDHADGDQPIEFYVFGRVHEVTRKHYVVDAWCYLDPDAERDDNVEGRSIVRKTITETVIYDERQGRPTPPGVT